MNKEEKINILLIDDRPENLIALESILDDPGFNLIKATSGQQALSYVLEYEFALILTDVQMPGMDGFETAELLRGKSESEHIPIIFVTASNKEQKYVFKGYEAGAVDYLFKPVEPAILKSKVTIFINLYRQQKLIRYQADNLKQKMEQLKETNFKLEEKEKAQKKLINELQLALSEIKRLSGLLPICAKCKKIRDDKGYWNEVESYISAHSEAHFSHGICPECSEKIYKEINNGKITK